MKIFVKSNSLKKHNRLLNGLFVSLVVLSGSANAALITQELVNVSILGDIYDVTFLQDDSGDSFNSYNAILPAITFTTASDAESAVDAILVAAGPDYDYTPAGFSDLNGFRVPFAVDDLNYFYMTGSEDRGALGPFEKSRDNANSLSFATFDLSDNITPVPEPSAFALLGLGLLGFSARKVKRKI